MRWIKTFLKYVLLYLIIPVLVVLSIDAMVGVKIASKLIENDKQSAIKRILTERQYRTTNNYYHHDLRPNYNGEAYWSNWKYKVCTDGSGFRSDCESNFQIRKQFDIAFIGDSFTEGIGLPYEKTFVGLVAKSLPNLRIANLGVSSYSPSIYFAKLKYLIENGYSFKEVIVFIDISDVQDEAISYDLVNDKVVSRPRREDPNEIPNPNGETQFFRWIERVCKKDTFPLSCKIFRDIKTNYVSPSNFRFFNYPRSAWTYNPNSAGYGELGVKNSLELSVERMNRLYELLNSKGIKLSVGVYPWPAQLLFDNEHSLQVKTWEDFCRNRCANFYNAFPYFWNEVRKQGVHNVDKKFFIKGDVHFSEEGNKVIASILLSKL